MTITGDMVTLWLAIIAPIMGAGATSGYIRMSFNTDSGNNYKSQTFSAFNDTGHGGGGETSSGVIVVYATASNITQIVRNGSGGNVFGVGTSLELFKRTG